MTFKNEICSRNVKSIALSLSKISILYGNKSCEVFSINNLKFKDMRWLVRGNTLSGFSVMSIY